MPGLQDARSIWPEILPVDGIPLDGLECDPSMFPGLLTEGPVLFTLQHPTPFLRGWHCHTREVRPATLTVCCQVDHEGALSVTTTSSRPGPVVVVSIVARRVVSLRPHALDEQVGSPALERARAFLDAAHCVVAVE